MVQNVTALITLVVFTIILMVGAQLLQRKSTISRIFGVVICVAGLVAAWGFLDPGVRDTIQSAWEEFAKAFKRGANNLPGGK